MNKAENFGEYNFRLNFRSKLHENKNCLRILRVNIISFGDRQNMKCSDESWELNIKEKSHVNTFYVDIHLWFFKYGVILYMM